MSGRRAGECTNVASNNRERKLTKKKEKAKPFLKKGLPLFQNLLVDRYSEQLATGRCSTLRKA